MRKPPLYAGLVLAALLLAAAGLVLYFPAKQRVASLQDTVILRVEEALQKNVILEVGGARLGLRRGLGFRLYDISLQERAEEPERILEARYLFVGVAIAPLLRGDIRIRRIFVFQPRVFLTRDPAGRLNVAGLFSAAYARRQARDTLRDESLFETFGPLLWREEISVKNAEIVYRDANHGGGEGFRVRKLDVLVSNRLDVDRLEFRVLGEVFAQSALATVDLRAEVSGWKTAASLKELSSAAELSLRGGDLQGWEGLFPGIGPGDVLKGSYTGQLSYEGSLLLPGKGHLDLVLEAPHVSLGRVHPRPFTPDRVVLRAPFEAAREGIVFSGSRLDLGGMLIHWDGAFRFHGGRLIHLDLDLSGEDLPLVEAKSYIPLGLLKGETWRFLTAMVREGRVDARARLQGAPEDFSRLAASAEEDVFSLRLRFRDCTVVLPLDEPYLPFHSTQGVLELSRGTVYFRDFRAAYGRTSIPEIHGSIRNVHHRQSHLSIQAGARLHIPEIFQELDHGIFPDALRRFGRSLQEAEGKGTLSIAIDYPYGRDLEGQLEVQGVASLEGVRATWLPLGLSLTEMTGRIGFTESSVSSLDIHLMADRSPVQLTGSVRFGRASHGATGELRFASPHLHAEDLVPRLGLGARVRGRLHATGVVAWQNGTLGWQSNLHGDELEVSAGSYVFPVREVVLEVHGCEASFEVPSFRARVQGNDVAGEGRWSSLKPLKGRVDLRSSELDLDRLVQKRKKREKSWDAVIPASVLRILHPREGPVGVGTHVRLGLKLERLTYRNFEASDVQMEGGVTSEKLYVEFAHGNCGGGGFIAQGQADLLDPRLPFSMLIGLSQVRTEAYLNWFSVAPGFIEGTASVEGSLRGSLRPAGAWWKDLYGAFSLFSEGSTIKRYDLLSKTLTLVNFTQWTRVRLSDLYARGLPCRQIQGNVRLEKGSLSTEDLVVDTSIARVTFRGTYDIRQDHVDAAVTLQPMEQLDQVLDALPVLGKVISGPDGTVVVFHYALHGPLQDLSIALVPFKTFDDRIGSPLRRMNRWLQNMDQRFERRDEGSTP